MTPVVDSLRNYILGFPELPDSPIQIDYLGSEGSQYTLEPTPCDPIYRKYTDGGCLRQMQFLFASREFYCADVDVCRDNQGFYEKFARWIEDNNRNNVLPDLGDGRRAIDIEVLSSSYAFSETADTARYQIQLRLIYEED